MLLLALASVLLLGWEMFTPGLDEATRQRIWTVDYVICAVFAAEFLWRWRAAGWSGAFLARNWYEILGMIPLHHPALRAFRLLRVIVLLARLGRAADRALGDEFTYRLVRHFKNAIVDAVSTSVTVAVLDEVLVRGHYAANIARALDENRGALRAMIAEKLEADPQAGRLARLPFARELNTAVIDSALRVVEQVLLDPRTDELIADMLRENLNQIRASVEQRGAQGLAATRGAPDNPPP